MTIKENALRLALVGSVLMQHFQIFMVGGFSVTIGLVVGVPVLLYFTGSVRGKETVVVLSAVGAYSAMVALTQPWVADPWNFFTTFGLLILALFVMSFSWGGLKPELVDVASSAMWISLVVIVGYSVLQVLGGAAGSEFFFNPFRQFQYQYQYHPYLEFNPIPRAQGFFLEPSYAAFVIGSLSVALLVLGRRLLPIAAVAIVGMAATRSATGMLLLVCVLLILALKTSRRIAIPLVLGVAVFIGVFLPYLAARIGSLADVGSSSNYRIVAPLSMLADILMTSPTGLPLGSIYDVVPAYGLSMDGVEQTISLDNGVYVLVYYFGWVAVVLLVIGVILTVRSLIARRHSGDRTWAAPLWLFGSLLFSGGVVAPEFALMSTLVAGSFFTKSVTGGRFDVLS